MKAAARRRLAGGLHFAVDTQPNVGYAVFMVSKAKASAAGSALGKRSVKARITKWGRAEYLRRQQMYGRMGGRPKGNSKKEGGDK